MLLSVTVRRLLLDRIEATVYSWTVSGDSKNAAMHVHVAAFPYLLLLCLVGDPEDPVVIWNKLADQFEKKMGQQGWICATNCTRWD